jgi:hypothetical protein
MWVGELLIVKGYTITFNFIGFTSVLDCLESVQEEEEEEEEEVAPNYTEEDEAFSVEQAQVYQAQSDSTQEIDPVLTLERMCNWLGSILRKPDLARKLDGARLKLEVDENGENIATFWLADEGIDPRSFSLEEKSLIRMAFSTEVRRGYKLQIGNGEMMVLIE